jgi:hypothetical protein
MTGGRGEEEPHFADTAKNNSDSSDYRPSGSSSKTLIEEYSYLRRENDFLNEMWKKIQNESSKPEGKQQQQQQHNGIDEKIGGLMKNLQLQNQSPVLTPPLRDDEEPNEQEVPKIIDVSERLGNCCFDSAENDVEEIDYFLIYS